MRFVGIDLSLSSTGVCVLDEDGGLLEPHAIKTKRRGQSMPDRFERYDLLIDSVYDAAIGSDGGYFTVAIEGYSYGNHIKGLGPLIECGGVLRRKLLLDDCVAGFIEIPPSCVKKWATSKGNATKQQIILDIACRYGVEFRTDDEADAFCLAKIAWQMRDIERCETFNEECVVRKVLGPSGADERGA